ncbi:MAG: excalibur calcium-binding domain-containing protein, partial [Pseudomonadota bacterium]
TKRRRRFPTGLLLLIGPLAICGVVALRVYALEDRQWTLGEKVRHVLASPNCTAARLVRLAPAFAGEPGYYPSHDADNDDIACEPYPR